MARRFDMSILSYVVGFSFPALPSIYLAKSESTSPFLISPQAHISSLGSLHHQSQRLTDARKYHTMGIATSLRPFTLLLLAATVPTAYSHDPCGPLIQGPNVPNNTCNTTINLVTKPSVYGALLLNDGSGLNVTWYNCLPVVFDACTAITAPSTPTGAWNWTDPGSQCVMGFWLPQYNGSAPLPSYESCVDNIFTPMYNIGMDVGGTRFNQVTVNLVNLPDNYQTGSQVDIGYPSYMISYLPLQQGAEIPLTRG